MALLGPGWRVIDPPPRAVVFEPSSSSLFVSVRSRASGKGLLGGSWDADFVGPLQAKVAELSERLEVPHFRLNGRRGEVLDGRST
ncbi:hypothetical protein, partial [Actinoplanes sp. NBRC 103695]|uniref:hypothetical protein n=1 Tax=Actinoplanes sp. NBRC 103695 TaxID=3032202 RepID=UPI0025523899